MKKFINEHENIVPELLQGLVLSQPDKVRLVGSNLVARAKRKPSGKVGVITMGGSGHEPGLSGFVGEGMLDVSVAGEIFAAPGAPRCVEAMTVAEGGAGVLFIVLNHSGDVLSANMAMAMAQKQRLNVKMILVHDDIACGPNPDNRRGLVGFLPVYKIAGAAAEAGLSLAACLELAERMQRNTRTLAVAVTSATHPSTGQPIFDLADDEMEIGMGQHGEAGTGRMKMQTADKTTDLMLNMLLDDLNVQSGEELLVIVNGAGATTLMELLIVFRRVHQVLQERKINLVRSKIGEFITTQEQGGFQLMISRMDSELIQLWDAPSNTPYFVTA